MKQSVVIVMSLVVLLGACFTVLQSSKAATKNKTYCCKKTCGEKKDNKAAAPLPYFPITSVFSRI